MALVRTIGSAGARNTGRVHGEVRCEYSIFEEARRTYLQLDTYGSPERANPDKVSQSLQFDEEGARKLKALINRAFPSL
jgi:hypothetical protein